MKTIDLPTFDITLVEEDIPIDWLLAAEAQPVVGMDTETSGLNHHTDRIACVQMYVPGKGVLVVRNLQRKPLALIDLMENNNVGKIFHHALFDLKFLTIHAAMRPTHIIDTKVAAKLLDPKRTKFISQIDGKGSHRLESLVFGYFGFQMNKAIAISNWFAPELTDEQIKYASADVYFLPELVEKLYDDLAGSNKRRMAIEAMRHIPLRVQLELSGQEDIYGYK